MKMYALFSVQEAIYFEGIFATLEKAKEVAENLIADIKNGKSFYSIDTYGEIFIYECEVDKHEPGKLMVGWIVRDEYSIEDGRAVCNKEFFKYAEVIDGKLIAYSTPFKACAGCENLKGDGESAYCLCDEDITKKCPWEIKGE